MTLREPLACPIAPKNEVNVVNMVNVAEHVMSYAKADPPDHVPKPLGIFGMIEMTRTDAA